MNPMSAAKGRKWLVIPLILVFLIVGRILTIGQKEDVKGIAKIQQEEGVPVDVTQIARRDIEVWEAFSGTVKGIRQGTIRANGPNIVDRVHRQVGERVNKNEVIISLDPDYPQMGLSRYKQAKASYENALRELNRLEPLYQEGAVSDREIDGARTALESAKAEWLTVQSWVDLGSPISGVITYLGVEEGERAETGELLATVADVSRIRVILQVDERSAREIRTGQAARVPDHGNSGEVRSVSLSADPRSRLFEIEVEIDNPEQVLRPETIVDVEIALDARGAVLAVPKDALVLDDGRWFAFRIADGEAERVLVEIGLMNRNDAEVLAGLEEGDRIVVNGQNRLEDGAKVQIHREI